MDFTNFIYHKENAITEEFCREIIESGKAVIESGALNQYHAGKHQFKEKQFARHDLQIFMPANMTSHFGEIQNVVFDAVEEYGSEVQSIHDFPLICSVMKLQITPLTGGYSVWHSEHGPGASASRVLAWSIYLNDVAEGGETEFLYQRVRYQPKTGSLLMWPAGITHPHRGNPPLSNEKIILTGWVCCATSETENSGLNLLKETYSDKAIHA